MSHGDFPGGPGGGGDGAGDAPCHPQADQYRDHQGGDGGVDQQLIQRPQKAKITLMGVIGRVILDGYAANGRARVPSEIKGRIDQIHVRAGLLLPHPGKDGIHHPVAQGHIVIFRVPNGCAAGVVHLHDIAVAQGVHAKAVQIIQVPAAVILRSDGIRQGGGMGGLLLGDVLVKLPLDEKMGGQADQKHRQQHGQGAAQRQLKPQAFFH